MKLRIPILFMLLNFISINSWAEQEIVYSLTEKPQLFLYEQNKDQNNKNPSYYHPSLFKLDIPTSVERLRRLIYNFEQILINGPREQCQSAFSSRRSLQEILENCPLISQNMIWNTADGRAVRYIDWSDEQKDRLNILFQYIQRRDRLYLDCSPYTVENSSGHYFRDSQAFNIYAAHLAHALHLEQNNLVPWKLIDLNPSQLESLFNSNRYFSILPSYPYDRELSLLRSSFAFQSTYQDREITRCDPRTAYDFMRGAYQRRPQNLIGSTPEETLALLTKWLKNNVENINPSQAIDLRITTLSSLEERLTGRNFNDKTIIPNLSSSRSAAVLIQDLARSVNIPLKIFSSPPALARTEESIVASNEGFGLIAFENSPQERFLINTNLVHGSSLRFVLPQEEVISDPSNPGLYGIDPIFGMNFYFQHQWLGQDTIRTHLVSIYWMNFNWNDIQLIPSNQRWPFSEIGFVIHPDLSNIIGRELENRNFYELCSANLLMDFCRLSRSAFIEQYNHFSLPTNLLAPFRSGNDYYEKANACVEARRGCGSVFAQIYNWEGEFGENSADY